MTGHAHVTDPLTTTIISVVPVFFADPSFHFALDSDTFSDRTLRFIEVDSLVANVRLRLHVVMFVLFSFLRSLTRFSHVWKV